jgi:hypothetical protein
MKSSPPKKHPAPLESELWRYLKNIRAWRRKRKTWHAIAKELEQAYGLRSTAGTVRNFFKRASKRVPLQRNVRTQARAPHVQTPYLQPGIPSTALDDDPFSTKVVPFDPWKPQTKAQAS